jgi:peptide/nickel transport system permease protein
MRRSASFVAGAVMVGLVVAMCLVSLVWLPYPPARVDPAARLLGPGWPHLFGTDGLGLDIFSRILVGSRICLLVGGSAVAIGALIGVPLGLVGGTSSGLVSAFVMRVSDLVYAFPALLLAILLAAARGGGSVATAVVAIGIASIPAFARVARGATLQVMSQDFVLAARASGTPRLLIAATHVLPNIAPVVLVQASSSFGLAILAEASLSYLGLGAPATTPSWGRMLYDARAYLVAEPNVWIWPGLFIAIAVMGFNLLGDGLRDALDPRLGDVR